MRTGRQEPTFSVVGDYAYSYGSEVVEMFEEEGGATFYPSQEQELEIMLARNKNGSPAALTIGISKPRQNGKSYAARYYAVYMSVFEHRQVLYSAHHSSTTNKMFKALCNLFESPERYPEFYGDVKNISHARGYEGIYFKDWRDEDGRLHDGGCIEFSTRTNSGARGGTYSVIIIDEAQELTKDQQEAMLPVMSAASEVEDVAQMPQQIFIGTPPAPSCHGTVFADMHHKAHGKEKSEIWWMEWAIESKDLAKDLANDSDALEAAYETNPALGYRIAEKTILNEFETMALDGFARERLGWWTATREKQLDYAIDAKAWSECISTEKKPDGKTAFGVKFSPDGSEVCLAGAVIPPDGKARVSVIERKPTALGTAWLADFLRARYMKACCVVIDGRNGVDVLIDKIADVWKVKGSIMRPGAKEIVASTGILTDAIIEHEITWYEGQDDLNDSATTSVKRTIGGGFGFGGDNSLPIEAVALAYYGAKVSKRDPGRKMRIG